MRKFKSVQEQAETWKRSDVCVKNAVKAESDRFITLQELEKLIERLNSMSYEERIHKLKLRPDRADVIVPASIVLHMIASRAGVKQIAIPNVGLKDGVLLDIAGDLSQRPASWAHGTGVGICITYGTQISI